MRMKRAFKAMLAATSPAVAAASAIMGCVADPNDVAKEAQ